MQATQIPTPVPMSVQMPVQMPAQYQRIPAVQIPVPIGKIASIGSPKVQTSNQYVVPKEQQEIIRDEQAHPLLLLLSKQYETIIKQQEVMMKEIQTNKQMLMELKEELIRPNTTHDVSTTGERRTTKEMARGLSDVEINTLINRARKNISMYKKHKAEEKEAEIINLEETRRILREVLTERKR